MSFRHPGSDEHARRLEDHPPGDCFRQAFWFCESYSRTEPGRIMLVHGFPALQAEGENFGKPYAHAWVEITTIHDLGDGIRVPTVEVIDPSREGIANPTRVPQAIYYWAGKVEHHAPPRKYNGAQAVAALIEHRHYGGWEPYPAGVLCKSADGTIMEAE